MRKYLIASFIFISIIAVPTVSIIHAEETLPRVIADVLGNEVQKADDETDGDSVKSLVKDTSSLQPDTLEMQLNVIASHLKTILFISLPIIVIPYIFTSLLRGYRREESSASNYSDERTQSNNRTTPTLQTRIQQEVDRVTPSSTTTTDQNAQPRTMPPDYNGAGKRVITEQSNEIQVIDQSYKNDEKKRIIRVD
ncbi:hypothetical protein [Brevibacillus reuszeri]|uniref:hypothetical protein n=1 Tax=Brevibacillus reuszeri TaxID=54915 RepID=UPI000CCC6275|nr:hypothetical protein [Brevibacillus reuszeri]